MPRIRISAAPSFEGTSYPSPFDLPCRARKRRALGDAAGLADFGVNLQELAPGSWSSQRHWHTSEDEFVWVLEGEVVLVEDGSEEILRAGDCAGFPKGVANGHHLQNRSAERALLLVVGTRREAVDVAEYPDIDLHWSDATRYTHKDGRPYGE